MLYVNLYKVNKTVTCTSSFTIPFTTYLPVVSKNSTNWDNIQCSQFLLDYLEFQWLACFYLLFAASLVSKLIYLQRISIYLVPVFARVVYPPRYLHHKCVNWKSKYFNHFLHDDTFQEFYRVNFCTQKITDFSIWKSTRKIEFFGAIFLEFVKALYLVRVKVQLYFSRKPNRYVWRNSSDRNIWLSRKCHL